MKNEQPIYAPATTAGGVWRLETYKPQGRPAFAYATFGELKTEDGYQCFMHMEEDFKPAYTRVAIEGAATAKKKAAAIEQLIQQLKAAGQVPQEA